MGEVSEETEPSGLWGCKSSFLGGEALAWLRAVRICAQTWGLFLELQRHYG